MARADTTRIDLGAGAGAGDADDDEIRTARMLADIDARIGARLADDDGVLPIGVRGLRVPGAVGGAEARRRVRDAPAAPAANPARADEAGALYALFNALGGHMSMARHALFISRDAGPAGTGAYAIDDLARRMTELRTVEERDRFLAEAMRASGGGAAGGMAGGAAGGAAGGTLEFAAEDSVVAGLSTDRVYVAQAALNAAYTANTQLRTLLKMAYGARLGDEAAGGIEDITDLEIWRAILARSGLLANYCNLAQLFYGITREATGRTLATANGNVAQYGGLKGWLAVFGGVDTMRVLIRALAGVGAPVSIEAFEAAAPRDSPRDTWRGASRDAARPLVRRYLA